MHMKCGGIAVRRPLQPRENNVVVAPSTVVIGTVPKPKARAPRRPAAAAVEKLRSREVSLAEELEKARERRGRLWAAREVTQREMDGQVAAFDREAAGWERRAEEQHRLVAELMRLIGMPEVYAPAESLRSREERRRQESDLLAQEGSRDSTSMTSPLQGGAGGNSSSQESRARVSSSQESRARVSTEKMEKRTEISSLLFSPRQVQLKTEVLVALFSSQV